jgi:hypothetical protein
MSQMITSKVREVSFPTSAPRCQILGSERKDMRKCKRHQIDDGNAGADERDWWDYPALCCKGI